jgi:hypothetical protein
MRGSQDLSWAGGTGRGAWATNLTACASPRGSRLGFYPFRLNSELLRVSSSAIDHRPLPRPQWQGASARVAGWRPFLPGRYAAVPAHGLIFASS